MKKPVKKTKPTKPAKKLKLKFWQNLKQQTWKQRSKNWRFYGLIIGFLLVCWLLLIIVVGSWYQIKHRNDPVQLGVSFSVDTAKHYGSDWHKNFLGLLQDVQVKHFRLMSYWNNIEPEQGKYDFKDLDWQFSQAEKHGADISLAIGIRQPRWPECHQPDWVKKLPENQKDDQLYNYLSAVINHVKNKPALRDYQLENEVANHSFGECNTPSTKFNRTRLTNEFNTVKSIDQNHPVDINVSNQSGVPIGQPVTNEVGFSMYKTAWVNSLGPLHFYWSFGYVPPIWHSYRAGLIELLHGEPAFVHELQTEPWGPTDTKNLSITEQNKSMTAQKMVNNVHFANNTGMHRVYLWGGEWWYWRLTKFKDPSVWDTAKQMFIQTNQTGKFDPSTITIPPMPKS